MRPSAFSSWGDHSVRVSLKPQYPQGPVRLLRAGEGRGHFLGSLTAHLSVPRTQGRKLGWGQEV